MARLKGWRFVVFFGAFIGSIATPMYFTAIQPALDPTPYKQIREVTAPKLRPKDPYT